MLVLHGDEDALPSHTRGAALAEATGGQLVTLQGSGHFPQARDPVVINLLVREFVRAARRDRRRSAQHEQTRARYPDEEGFVERDGVRVFYEVYGDAPTTFLLFPTSPISHSRLWKAQVPYLSRHFRVVTFDPRGNGRSDRPTRAEAYSWWEYVADGRAVLEASGADRALLGGLCDGGGWALMLAATHPARGARRRDDRAVPCSA